MQVDASFPGRLLDLLESLNRKERFWLVNQAVGGFELDEGYRRELGEAVGLVVPETSFVAMDYHLDWIAGAIALASAYTDLAPGAKVPRRTTEVEGEGIDLMVGNQEDVDLIVGFAESSTVHLLLIEAKFDSGWSNSVMNHKTRRFGEIFGRSGTARPQVQPHFIVTSPRRPTGLLPESWPDWMKTDAAFNWISLQVSAWRTRIERTTESGQPSRDGEWVTLKPVRVPRDDRFMWQPGDIQILDSE